MKKLKINLKVFIPLGIILVLLIYIIIPKGGKLYSLPVLPELNREQITQIRLTNKGKTYIINKKGDEWVVSDKSYKTESEVVNDILDSITTLQITDLVDTEKGYGQYDLDEDSRIKLEIFNEKDSMRILYVGKRATTYRQAYVKLEGDDNVYLCSENINNVLDKELKDLRDKNVLSFDTDSITEIIVEKSDETIKLVRHKVSLNPEGDKNAEDGTDTIWKTEDGLEFEKLKADGLLNGFMNLECSEYTYFEPEADEQLISFVFKGAEEYKIILYNKIDEQYPAKSSMNQYAFFLPSWKADRMIGYFEDEKEEEKTQ